jgi:hypothetical protein
MDPVLARRGGWRRAILWPGLSGRFLLPASAGASRSYSGRLIVESSGVVAVYVKHPPRNGRYAHEHCLQYVGAGWFRLHFERPPHHVDNAVVFTEHFLLCCARGSVGG